MATATSLLSAEQFAATFDPGHPQELIRGVVVHMPPPTLRHGQICGNILYHVRRFLDDRRIGHVVCNDAGVVTERSPDTVRGADVAFYSFAKLPQGPLPEGYSPVPPDAVFEVLSESDRWADVLRKVAEYLTAGVPAVYVFEPELLRIQAFFRDQSTQIFGQHDTFAGHGPLADWMLSTDRFFS
jgi:Uma2 family endonuclease